MRLKLKEGAEQIKFFQQSLEQFLTFTFSFLYITHTHTLLNSLPFDIQWTFNFCSSSANTFPSRTATLSLLLLKLARAPNAAEVQQAQGPLSSSAQI